MPSWFLLVFAGIAAVAAATRLSGRGHAPPTGSWSDLGLIVLGGLGLAYHCGAMFYTSSFRGALGLGGYANTINALGVGSEIAFVVPAVLLIVGVRRQPIWYVAAVVVVLAAVGVTMYDGGPLDAHLGAIMLAALVIIAGVVLMTARPGTGSGPTDRDPPAGLATP